jgi:hypothetical protein
MKFFNIEVSSSHTIRGVLLRTPWFAFVIEVTPLWETSNSITQRTDPLLMDRQQRHENTVRIFLERKGYPRKKIDLPLTDERMKEIGRMTWSDYKQFIKTRERDFENYEARATEPGEIINIKREANEVGK